MLKTLPLKDKKKLKKKLQLIFHEFIRLRDLDKGCISCGRWFLMGANWHAGHYYPRSTEYAALWFDEMNTNGQCRHCNTFLEGNKQGYARGLLKRHGAKALDDLDVKRAVSKGNVWTVFHYEILISEYKKKVSQLKKGTTCQRQR